MTASWFAVAVAGATIVTLMLVMFVMLVRVMRMPGAITGGAPVTTAGGVPIGAGTISP